MIGLENYRQMGNSMQNNLIDKNPILGGFRQSLRFIHANVIDLRVTRGWTSNKILMFSDASATNLKMWQTISGTAVLDTDSIELIGLKNTLANQLSFQLSPFDDWNSQFDEWKQLEEAGFGPLINFEEEDSNSDKARIAQFLRNCYSNFDKRPPTVYISHSDTDSELRHRGGWDISCKVPLIVFDSLVNDYLQGRSSMLSILFTLIPALVNDEHAPPNIPVRFGLLSSGTGSAGSWYGRIESLSWQPGNNAYSESKPEVGWATENVSVDTITQENLTPFKQDNQESNHTLSKEISALRSTINKGIIVVSLIILLIALIP